MIINITIVVSQEYGNNAERTIDALLSGASITSNLCLLLTRLSCILLINRSADNLSPGLRSMDRYGLRQFHVDMLHAHVNAMIYTP